MGQMGQMGVLFLLFTHKKNNNFRKEAAHKIVAKKTLKPTIWKLIHETKRKCVYRPTDLVQLYHDPSQLIVINQQKSLTFINVTKIIDKRSGFHCLSVYVDKLTVLGPCDFIPYGNMEILTAKLPQRWVFFLHSKVLEVINRHPDLQRMVLLRNKMRRPSNSEPQCETEWRPDIANITLSFCSDIIAVRHFEAVWKILDLSLQIFNRLMHRYLTLVRDAIFLEWNY